MKCVTYNIQYGMGRDRRFDLGRIAANIAGADVIALQEVTRNFPRNGGSDLVAGLAALLPDYFHVFGATVDIDPGALGADRKPANRRFQFGNMLFSRWPILSSRNLLLPRRRSYDRGNLQRGALEGLIVTPFGPIRFYCVHLDHTSEEERMMQVQQLAERVFAYPLEGGAITGAAEYGFPEPPSPEDFVLMGDFNMRPGRPDYELLVGAPDPVFGRRLVAHHPVDVSRLAGDEPEGTLSWIDNDDPAKRARLDYGFVSAGLAKRVKRAWIDADAQGSDHMPVWFELD
jgi:endonuclease/exonuclease/phosphatase family metal-dependent hydrolase